MGSARAAWSNCAPLLCRHDSNPKGKPGSLGAAAILAHLARECGAFDHSTARTVQNIRSAIEEGVAREREKQGIARRKRSTLALHRHGSRGVALMPTHLYEIRTLGCDDVRRLRWCSR